MVVLTCIFIFLAFLVSASCGLGGSLILIPVLTLLLGVKEGIVVSSLLLGLNNVVKVIYYRKNIRIGASWKLLLPMLGGTLVGALLMLQLDAHWLGAFLLVHVCISFLLQRYGSVTLRRGTGITYAGLSGFCSGLSGTSGPLKGIAVKCFHEAKAEVVATASILSLAADSLKSGIFLTQMPGLELDGMMLAFGVVVMPIATGMGRYINERMSSRAYDALFYTVMSGYVLRLFI